MAYEQRVTRRQKVRYNSDNDDNALVAGLVLDGVKTASDSATIAVTDPDGTSVLAATAMTTNGSFQTYFLDTTTIADFPIAEGYRADIVFTYGDPSKTAEAHLMFDVVKFLFRLNIAFDQLVAFDDGVRGMQMDGDEDLSNLIVAVEDELQAAVESKVIDDGRMMEEMILDASRLALPAKLKILYRLFNSKKDYDHADRYLEQYNNEIRAALSSIRYDVAQDGLEDTRIGGWQSVRLVQ